MTDKVQKIREEIEKIKTVHSSVDLKESNPDILVVQVCTNLLSFIDSLQEESVELKEMDINKKISQFIDTNFEKATIGYKLSLRRVAKHFFELGMIDEEKKRLHDIQNVPVDEDKLKRDRSNTL